MKPTVTLLFSALGATLLPAQNVSFTVTTATPMSAQASAGGLVVTNVVPANTPGFGYLVASDWGGAVQIESTWGAFASDVGASASWVQKATLTSAAGPSDSASTGPSELLMVFTAAVPTPIAIDLTHTLVLSAGTIAPAHSIDIDDDGTFELDETSLAPYLVHRTVGPQGVSIRLRSQVARTGPGSVDLAMNAVVRPQNFLQIFTGAEQCSSVVLDVSPTFVGRGVVMTPPGPGNSPVVAVIGLSMQPVVLPPVHFGTPPTPCLLVPAADILVFVPWATDYVVQLPAALRPVQFWVQGVGFVPNGLSVTNSHRVLAN